MDPVERWLTERFAAVSNPKETDNAIAQADQYQNIIVHNDFSPVNLEMLRFLEGGLEPSDATADGKFSESRCCPSIHSLLIPTLNFVPRSQFWMLWWWLSMAQRNSVAISSTKSQFT
jgi:hypothetical protein